jgi:signal transduction histidine kinase
VDAPTLDQARQFKGFWTFDRSISLKAADRLLEQVARYRPNLADQLEQARQHYGLTTKSTVAPVDQVLALDARLFTDRLVTYLQSSQYKLLRSYRTIATQERKERLINSITAAIRRSLNLDEILAITVAELGQVFSQCRCLLYRYAPQGQICPLEYESVGNVLAPMAGTSWALADSPMFQASLTQNRIIAIADVNQDLGLSSQPTLKAELNDWQIQACLIVPIRYQQRWLGILEIHSPAVHLWQPEELSLVEAIAFHTGVALMQAQAYSNLETLNQQLSNLEQTQNNLVAIVGHELRTPLSTIQVCLESLASEPTMPPDLQQTMLEMALGDSERLRKLVQDFLLLSRLESGLAYWHPEPIALQESLDLVLSSFSTAKAALNNPLIIVDMPLHLPPVQADGEGLIEVLTKLLDNACKFTQPDGKIIIRAIVQHREKNTLATSQGSRQTFLEVMITDTGRGIESNQLETIFERFYQTEGFLQRTVGGSGLGLAICRRIVEKMGGTIWATSAGMNQGSTFHFTIPLAPHRYD